MIHGIFHRLAWRFVDFMHFMRGSKLTLLSSAPEEKTKNNKSNEGNTAYCSTNSSLNSWRETAR